MEHFTYNITLMNKIFSISGSGHLCQRMSFFLLCRIREEEESNGWTRAAIASGDGVRYNTKTRDDKDLMICVSVCQSVFRLLVTALLLYSLYIIAVVAAFGMKFCRTSLLLTDRQPF